MSFLDESVDFLTIKEEPDNDIESIADPTSNTDMDEFPVTIKTEPLSDDECLCRACAKPCLVLESILLEPHSRPTSLILQYFNIQVKEDDILPRRLCIPCNSTLENWTRYVHCVNEAQNTLHSKFLAPVEAAKRSPGKLIIDEAPAGSSQYELNTAVSPIIVKPEIESAGIFFTDELPSTSSVHPESVSPRAEIMPVILSVTSIAAQDQREPPINRVPKVHSQNKTSLQLRDLKKMPKRPLSPTNPFQCGLCIEKFNKPPLLFHHLKQHQQFNPHMKTFVCPHCSITFRQLASLVNHQIGHVSGKEPYFCKFCDKQFLYKNKLQEHEEDNHTQTYNPVTFKCPFCPYGHKKIINMKHHVSRTHNLSSYDVDKHLLVVKYLEDVALSKNSEFAFVLLPLAATPNSTYMVHRLNTFLEIPECTPNFYHILSMFVSVSRNLLLSKDITMLACDICEKYFRNYRELLVHKFSEHLKSGLFPCKMCLNLFKKSDDLDRHVCSYFCNIVDPHSKLKANQEYKLWILKCNACSKYFPSRQSLQNHLRCLSESHPYRCTLCNLSFKFKATWKSHISSSHPKYVARGTETLEIISEKPNLENSIQKHRKCYVNYILAQYNTHLVQSYPCEVCGLSFDKRGHLYRHLLEVHATPTLTKCPLCPTHFFYQQDAHKHFNVHIHSRIVCPVCSKDCKNFKALSVHLCNSCSASVHECHLCSKVLNSESALALHIKWHNMRDVTCDFCSENFISRVHLLKHVCQHLGVYPFTCPTCKKGFVSKTGMMRHLCVHFPPKSFVDSCN